MLRKEPFAGYAGRFLHSQHMTLVDWTIAEGAAFPEHAHPHEQILAVIDGRFELTIDGRPAPHFMSFVVRAGGKLRFGRRLRGARAYLAIAGGVAVPPTLGSRATHLISHMGGLDGRALIAGDRLPLGDRPARPAAAARLIPAVTALPQGAARIRVLAGPQVDYFAADALETLQSAPYTVGHHFRCYATGRAPGARVGTADSVDGRSADRGRVPEACDGHFGRHQSRRSARPWRYALVRRLLAARGDGGADCAGAGRHGSSAPS